MPGTANAGNDASYLLQGGFSSREMEAIRKEYGFSDEYLGLLYREMRRQEINAENRKKAGGKDRPGRNSGKNGKNRYGREQPATLREARRKKRNGQGG